MELDYALVDVFAERALEGNMLAIFTDARGLSDAQMQALARETNLAETTFILPAHDPGQELRDGVRVRIFTTQEELAFAGHPTLGTASWLFWNHPVLRGAEEIQLRLNVGTIPVRFEVPQPGELGVEATMAQRDPEMGAVHAHDEIAAVLGVSADDLDPALPPQTVSTGMAFVVVPFRTLEAIGRLEIPQAAAQRWLDAARAKFFYCLAPAAPATGAHFHARMQFYNGEDPATGSGAGCAIAYLVGRGAVPPDREIVIEQGIEIRRASRLRVQASLRPSLRANGSGGMEPCQVFVGGRTIPVARGRFFLP